MSPRRGRRARWAGRRGGRQDAPAVADRRAGKGALRLVSAWAIDSGLILSQVATDATSNEITAIPTLLRLLDLEGAIVTIDAMGCQTVIAAPIVERGADYVLALADYVLALEDNHPALHEPVCLAIGDPASLAYVDPERAWPGLHSIVRIESTRRIGNRVTSEARHSLSSLPADAPLLARAIRSHWGIENCLHWVLDVTFHEDASRVRDGHAPENLAILRHVALTLLRHDRSTRGSVATKRFRAALNDDYLRSILTGLSA